MIQFLLLLELTLILAAAGHVYTVFVRGLIRRRQLLREAEAERQRIVDSLQAWIDERDAIIRTEHEGVEDSEYPWVPCGYCGGQRRVMGPHPHLPGRNAWFLCGKCAGLGVDMIPPADVWPEAESESA